MYSAYYSFSGHPCLNNGSCSRIVHGAGGYVCACKVPFRGAHCEERYDACATQVAPCLNGGQCYYKPDAVHTPLCSCLEGSYAI